MRFKTDENVSHVLASVTRSLPMLTENRVAGPPDEKQVSRSWPATELARENIVMADAYGYIIDGEVRYVERSSYEEHLLSRLHEVVESWLIVFQPCRYGETQAISRIKLLEAVRRVLDCMEDQLDELQYRYSIKTQGWPHGRELSGGGGFTCKFKGERAKAEAGPGYCHIEAVTIVAGKSKWQPAQFVYRRLADLRDMKPVTTDDGIVLIPSRRRRPIKLYDSLRELATFLDSHAQDEVQQTVSRRSA